MLATCAIIEKCGLFDTSCGTHKSTKSIPVLTVGGRRALVERDIVKIQSCILVSFPFPPFVKGSKLNLSQRQSHLDDPLTSKIEIIGRGTLFDRSAAYEQPYHLSPEYGKYDYMSSHSIDHP